MEFYEHFKYYMSSLMDSINEREMYMNRYFYIKF